MPLNQSFQQVVEHPFQPLPQNEPMLSGKPTRVVATPQDQVVGLSDDDQFFLFLHRGLRGSSQRQADARLQNERRRFSNFDPSAVGNGQSG
jgi:hypothetical protein